jgi:hypothetical protein
MTTSQNPSRGASLISKILNSVLMNSFKRGEASSFVRARDLPKKRRIKKENRITVIIIRFMIKPPDAIIPFWTAKKKDPFNFFVFS